MYSNKMRPRVTKHDTHQLCLFENDGPKILIKIKDTHAFISHNLGISWKQISKVSGSHLMISDTNERAIRIIDRKTGRLYLIDGGGNLINEFVFKSNYSALSLHPSNLNAIILETSQSINAPDEDYLERVTCYYTKDGGASGFIVKSQCDYDDYDLDLPYETYYEFITGGVRDLIYTYDGYEGGYTAYALNFFSESPLKFISFPFVVHQTQDIFYAIKKNKELHVSEDGVNFEFVEFLPHSSPCESERNIESSMKISYFYQDYFDKDRKRRTKGSLFLQKIHTIESYPYKLPWITLFRYDVKRKEIRTMLDYCYDFLVVSAEEGVIIANYFTNPQGWMDYKERPRIRTVITFNDGIDWEPMTGPTGAEFSVNISDSLNRHLGDEPRNTSMMIVCGKEAPIESYRELFLPPSTTGLLSTYMTKDAGRSWRKIYDEAMEWMVGGDDDIIIMGQYDQKYVLYSLDCGMTWNKLTIGMRFPSWCSKYRTSSSSHSKRFWLDSYSISFDPADQLEQSLL